MILSGRNGDPHGRAGDRYRRGELACMRTALAKGFLCALEADVRNLVVSKVFISFLLPSEAVTSHDGACWKFEDMPISNTVKFRK